MRLLWICSHPTPYHSYFLKHLASDQEIDAFVYFTCRTKGTHPWVQEPKCDFPHAYCDTLHGRIAVLKDLLAGTATTVVIPGWSEPVNWLVLLAALARQVPFAIWSDTPNTSRFRTGIKGVFHTHLLPWAFAHAKFVMATGDVGVRAFKSIGCPVDKLVNLPFSVDLDVFSPSDSPCTSASKIVIASSGRLDFRHKGYDVAIRALIELRKALPELPFEYRIAGIGPDRDALQRLIAESGLSRQVVLLNWVEASELPTFYRSANIFLHPSRFDPFPNAVLEAMGCGLPVIGSDAAGSIVDRVLDGVNGYIFRSGDVSDLANRLIAAFQNRDKWPTMGRAARRTAEQWPVSKSVSTIRTMLRCE